MRLTVRLGNADDLKWAQRTVTALHYLRRPVDSRARPMVYVVEYHDTPVGLAMLGIPHATRCRGWWGYPGLPTQWQVVDISRIWLAPAIQRGNHWCDPNVVPGYTDRKGHFQPTTPTWLISEVLQRVQSDRVALWPPVQLSQPYHIRLAISYHDPKFHKGTIYRHSAATPMYTDADGNPTLGSSGKYGWCWRLLEPAWSWEWLDYRPRQLRLEAA